MFFYLYFIGRQPPISTLFPYTTLFRSDLVKGIIAVEPNGPPFYEVNFLGAPNWFSNGALGRPYGITRLPLTDRKSTRLNSSHRCISYAVFCLKKKKIHNTHQLSLNSAS